jgi:hypothetical protein
MRGASGVPCHLLAALLDPRERVPFANDRADPISDSVRRCRGITHGAVAAAIVAGLVVIVVIGRKPVNQNRITGSQTGDWEYSHMEQRACS